MSRDLYDGPGGNGCPLERFRARLIVYGLSAIGALCFGIAFWTIIYGGRT